MSKSEARRIAVQRNAKPAPLTMSAIERQLARVIHAARTAGPFGTSHRSEEEGLQNAKRKLVTMLAAMQAERDGARRLHDIQAESAASLAHHADALRAALADAEARIAHYVQAEDARALRLRAGEAS